ncbi:MAG: methionine--tRNA ligase, partial [Patescibacteria group bacterium]|nr:methionine--tRNA ligase [Patescibacteria group bacterium]
YDINRPKMKQVDEQINNQQISIEEFSRVQQRVGKVIHATYPNKSEKLIRLEVDFGDEQRIIFTGVRQFGYTTEDFIGKQFFFVVNLAPKKMMGEKSHGMILAVDGHDGKPVFISADGMPVGAFVR